MILFPSCLCILIECISLQGASAHIVPQCPCRVVISQLLCFISCLLLNCCFPPFCPDIGVRCIPCHTLKARVNHLLRIFSTCCLFRNAFCWYSALLFCTCNPVFLWYIFNDVYIAVSGLLCFLVPFLPLVRDLPAYAVSCGPAFSSGEVHFWTSDFLISRRLLVWV
jgi:hypothetical protein